jgi:hypothetical protein
MCLSFCFGTLFAFIPLLHLASGNITEECIYYQFYQQELLILSDHYTGNDNIILPGNIK